MLEKSEFCFPPFGFGPLVQDRLSSAGTPSPAILRGWSSFSDIVIETLSSFDLTDVPTIPVLWVFFFFFVFDKGFAFQHPIFYLFTFIIQGQGNNFSSSLFVSRFLCNLFHALPFLPISSPKGLFSPFSPRSPLPPPTPQQKVECPLHNPGPNVCCPFSFQLSLGLATYHMSYETSLLISFFAPPKNSPTPFNTLPFIPLYTSFLFGTLNYARKNWSPPPLTILPPRPFLA